MFYKNYGILTACNATIRNCEECCIKESATICTHCEQEYYTFDGSDCTGKHTNNSSIQQNIALLVSLLKKYLTTTTKHFTNDMIGEQISKKLTQVFCQQPC